MKFALRAFVLGICAAGASAAVLTSHSAVLGGHQMMLASSPMPSCGPNACTGNGKGGTIDLSPMPSCGPNACTGNGKGGTIALSPMPSCGPNACTGNGKGGN